MKSTSATNDGVGGTDIVRMKDSNTINENKGEIVKRPRTKASIREEYIA